MIFRTALLAIATSTALICSQSFAQALTPVRIRGEITAVDAMTLTVRRQGGETVQIALKPDQAVGSVKKLMLADITPGSFIGTATKTTPDDKLIAMEILVFPEAARGSGEGHYPWDLAPGSMMTNANVDAVVAGVEGRVLKLSYKGGSKDVIVPEDVVVVTPAPASRADLLVGKRVFMIATGVSPNLSAGRITVEKDGVAPPM